MTLPAAQQPAYIPQLRKRFGRILVLPEGMLGKVSTARREQSILEGISWTSGLSQEQRLFTELYRCGEFVIGVEKPGKEAAPDYKRCKHKDGTLTNNPTDMLPTAFRAGVRVERNLSFQDIFEALEDLRLADPIGLELLGTLLFRSGFMLDHTQNANGHWRHTPPDSVIAEIETHVPMIGDFPTRAFLCVTEALSLNEDIKYTTLGYNAAALGYGRRNNLLTYAHLIAVLQGKQRLFKFAGALSRPPTGVAPMTQKAGKEFFPLLGD